MRKVLLISLASLMTVTLSAQTPTRILHLDETEDTTDVTTVQEIINMQEEVTTRLANERHFSSVWGRQRYFNIAKNSSTLSPAETLESGVNYNDGLVPDFKSNWAVSIQLGRNYRLHKKPIGNTVQFYIDYTGIDLNVNHYLAEDYDQLYDSSTKPVEISSKEHKTEYFYRTPWMLEKYEFNYGMMLGPSVTIAPFNYVKNASGLHYFKMNFCMHFGWHASLLWMQNDSDKDVNRNEISTGFETMEKGVKMDWGHGYIHSVGFNISWKTIGFGYEHRGGWVKYKPIDTENFGTEATKFNVATNRIYVQLRLGK